MPIPSYLSHPVSDGWEFLQITQPAPQVLLIVLNRPEVANAFNTGMMQELEQVFLWLRANPRELRVCVLSGAGDKAFCAGADLKERKGMSNREWVLQHEQFERTFQTIRDCPIPLIASANGSAFAGGLELLLHCDFAYAVPNARFALTEVKLGLIPGCGGTQLLPRRIGTARAMEMVMSASPISAQQALSWGLVNRLFPSIELLAETLSMAMTIAKQAPVAVRTARHAISHGVEVDLHTALLFEIEAYQRVVGTQDRIEGVRAFNEKTTPVFQGY